MQLTLKSRSTSWLKVQLTATLYYLSPAMLSKFFQLEGEHKNYGKFNKFNRDGKVMMKIDESSHWLKV